MSTGQGQGTGLYEIRVRGHLEARWAAWFAGMTLVRESDGITNIRGPVVDQAALHGLLATLRDTGLPLVSITQSGPAHPHSDDPPSQPPEEAP